MNRLVAVLRILIFVGALVSLTHWGAAPPLSGLRLVGVNQTLAYPVVHAMMLHPMMLPDMMLSDMMPDPDSALRLAFTLISLCLI